MTAIQKGISLGALAGALLLDQSVCGGISRQKKNTASGASAGGVADADLNGGAVGTLGSTSVGGVIGDVAAKNKDQTR